MVAPLTRNDLLGKHEKQSSLGAQEPLHVDASAEPAKPSEVLDRAADLIEPEGAWTQGADARNADGIADAEWEGEGFDPVCFCAGGAIAHLPHPGFETNLAVQGYLQRSVGPSVVVFNDAPERTQAEVVAALRKAAELARGEGQ